ncbi:MAG TPA: hypothetical protein CFH82_05065 [Sulfurospirillum sp. UBA12182]|nr:MAG TPA: hypothetical protein CFH82_05065 [Sulfurospirillum sp. UBA12182]
MKKRTLKHNLWRKYKRKKSSFNHIRSIILACEDSVSSVTYFNTFLEPLKQNGKIDSHSQIIPHSGRTHPTGVLKDLIMYKTPSGKSFMDFDYRFIVIDRDKEKIHGAGHSKKDFNLALKKAKKYKVKVIYANPSFELWYLLHFEKRVSFIDRFEVIEEVIEKLKKLDEDKFRNLSSGNIKTAKMSKLIAKEIKKYKNNAIKNARELQKFHLRKKKSLDPEKDNPLTNIHTLILLFEDLAK